MENNAAIGQAELYAALAKAQGEFTPLAKNREVEIRMKEGGKYKFRYADLEAVISSTRPALAKNGLAVIQLIEPVNGANFNSLVTMLTHEGGGILRSQMNLPPAGSGDIKNYGASLSYLRRYALTALLCVAADDDLDENGEEAGNGQPYSNNTAEASKPAFYSSADFQKNLPSWKAGVANGKTTPERIVKMIESKAPLTDEQRKTILAIEVPQQ